MADQLVLTRTTPPLQEWTETAENNQFTIRETTNSNRPRIIIVTSGTPTDNQPIIFYNQDGSQIAQLNGNSLVFGRSAGGTPTVELWNQDVSPSDSDWAIVAERGQWVLQDFNSDRGATAKTRLRIESVVGQSALKPIVFFTSAGSADGNEILTMTDDKVADFGGEVRATHGLKVDVVPTASLPGPGTSMNGRVLIENYGAGDKNLILYAGNKRYRINGGAPF